MEEITSRENRLVKQFIRLSGSNKEREETGLFTMEGIKLVLEADRSGLSLSTVMVTSKCLEKQHDALSRVLEKSKCYLISDAVADKLSLQKTPQGIFAVASKLDKKLSPDKIYNSGKYLFLYGLQDAGNVGTMIRTADAMGLDGVIFSKGTCDVFQPKVVRGSMGSVFHLPMLETTDPVSLLKDLAAHGVETNASVVHSDAIPVDQITFQEPSVLLIGNEGNGLPDEIVKLCNRKITIHMPGNAESLNASMAACILLWEMTKS